MDLSEAQLQSQLFQAFLNSTSDAILFVDQKAEIKIWNRAAETLLAIRPENALGKNLFDLISTEDQVQQDKSDFQAAVSAGTEKRQVLERQVCRDDGTPIWVDHVTCYFQFEQQTWAYCQLSDAHPRRQREFELQRVATTDELSQLQNRRGFQKHIESNLHLPLTLAIIDIDHLKQINDRFGHEQGDEAIRLMAGLLRQLFEDAICVARLGGDEFGVVLKTKDRQRIENQFEQLLAETRQIHNHDQSEIDLTISIGLAISKRADLEARELLTAADQAMYRSKHAGRNRMTIVDIEFKSV